MSLRSKLTESPERKAARLARKADFQENRADQNAARAGQLDRDGKFAEANMRRGRANRLDARAERNRGA